MYFYPVVLVEVSVIEDSTQDTSPTRNTETIDEELTSTRRNYSFIVCLRKNFSQVETIEDEETPYYYNTYTSCIDNRTL